MWGFELADKASFSPNKCCRPFLQLSERLCPCQPSHLGQVPCSENIPLSSKEHEREVRKQRLRANSLHPTWLSLDSLSRSWPQCWKGSRKTWGKISEAESIIPMQSIIIIIIGSLFIQCFTDKNTKIKLKQSSWIRELVKQYLNKSKYT